MPSFRRWALRLVALPAALLLAGVATPAAGTVSLVPVGVTVGGLPVGGFTSEETRALLRERFAAPVRFELDGHAWAAGADELGVVVAVDATIAKTLHAPPGSAVDADAEVSRPDVFRYVTKLGPTLARAPQDARLGGLDAKLRPVIAPAVHGRTLDLDGTAAAIAATARAAQREPVRPVFHVRPARQMLPAVIVIRRDSKGLYLYNGRRLVRRLGVATGQWSYPTPLGTFAIVVKQYNPWWYPPSSDWAKGLKPVPPGPGNPLGTRWMGLNGGLVGIHGTPDAASIGYSASHGCIRMRIPDAEWLFARVRIGTPVVIVAR